ncbi:hypothetical protein T484DRAFT_1953831 [Baffinella frigidus]|nr:hypothetical protein T484DRAFT_1953831 [Cryptophyta sp. CCMP2293]
MRSCLRGKAFTRIIVKWIAGRIVVTSKAVTSDSWLRRPRDRSRGRSGSWVVGARATPDAGRENECEHESQSKRERERGRAWESEREQAGGDCCWDTRGQPAGRRCRDRCAQRFISGQGCAKRFISGQGFRF